MKRYVILIIAFLLIIAPIKSGAEIKGYEVVAKLSKQEITLYAKTRDGLYRDFKLDFKGTIYSYPFWTSTADKYTHSPKIVYEDINKDKQKELIIILNKGYGSGVLIEEVHVFNTEYNRFGEELVDNPLAIIYKNLKTKLTTEKAEVIVGNKVSIVDTKAIEPSHLFEVISFGSIIDYEVINNHLMVRVGGQITPAMFVGDIIIVYEYRDKMYQVKTIEFIPHDLIDKNPFYGLLNHSGIF